MTRQTQRHLVLDWIQTSFRLIMFSDLTSEFPLGSWMARILMTFWLIAISCYATTVSFSDSRVGRISVKIHKVYWMGFTKSQGNAFHLLNKDSSTWSSVSKLFWMLLLRSGFMYLCNHLPPHFPETSAVFLTWGSFPTQQCLSPFISFLHTFSLYSPSLSASFYTHFVYYFVHEISFEK